MMVVVLLSLSGTPLIADGDDGGGGDDAVAMAGTRAVMEDTAILRFDFGNRGSPVAAGWTQVTGGLLYSRGLGYGWDVAHEEFFNLRPPAEISPYVLQRSWVIGEYRDDMTADGVRDSGAMTFSADLPDGDYRVRVTVGDLFYLRYSMDVHAEGVQVASELAAFHMVFRTVYFKDGRGNWANYGMPLPYWFDVSVGDGRLDVTFDGDDDAFWARMDVENATSPPNSYLSEMSTGAINPGGVNPPYRFIGGPHTYNSVLGLEVYPPRRDLVTRDVAGLVLDASVTNATVRGALDDYNAATGQSQLEQLATGVQAMLADPGALAPRDAKALMELLGHLAGDARSDLDPAVLDRMDATLRSMLAGGPGDQTLWELLGHVERLRAGLEYIFQRVVTGTNHFYENVKAISRLWPFQPEDHLFPWASMWRARALYMLDPHRWTSASGTAADVMEALRPLDPSNPYIRMYRDTVPGGGRIWQEGQRVVTTTGKVDHWTLAELMEGWEGAPQWARWVREELYWLYDVTDWWVLNRQQADGALGGGWSDDVEFIGLFGFDALISQGADDLSLVGARRFVDGMLASGGVDLDKGYSAALADAEHTAEWTGDSLPMMIAVDFGNPRWVEFSYKTAALMRDLWMDRTDEGHLHFRSNFLSATQVGGAATQDDCYINYRAALPAHWVAWYNADPEVEALFVDWATSWVEDAMRTDDGKPLGVFPASVGFEGDELGGHNSPNWYTADHPSGSVNYDWQPQMYRAYLDELVRGAYEATGNLSLLEPFRLEAELAQAYLDNPVPSPTPGSEAWAGMVLGQRALDRWASIRVDYGLTGGGGGGGEPNGYTPEDVIGLTRAGRRYIDACLPLMTTEASATDRVAFVGIINPFMIFTGGGIGGALLAPKFTYTGLGRDFATCVMDARPEGASILMYGFFHGTREAGLVPWALEPGATYSIEVGDDADGDGALDGVPDYEGVFTWMTKGQVVPFELEGDGQKLVVVERTANGTGARELLPDLAVTPEGVSANETTGLVDVVVHNIGAAATRNYSVRVLDPDDGDRELGNATMESLDPPHELLPSTVVAGVGLTRPPTTDNVTVVLVPLTNITEITTLNNLARATINRSGLRMNGPPVYVGKTPPDPYYVKEDATADGPVAVEGFDLASMFADPDPGTELHYQLQVDRDSEPYINMSLADEVLAVDWLATDWNGDVTFSVMALDSGWDGVAGSPDDLHATSPEFTLVVLSVNDAPTYVGPPEGVNLTLDEDPPLASPLELVSVAELFEDVDGDSLRFALLLAPDVESYLHIEIAGDILLLTRCRTDWYGYITFTIVAYDPGPDGIPGNGDDIGVESPVSHLVIDPVNDPPFPTWASHWESLDMALRPGENASLPLAWLFSDIEGDTLFYTWEADMPGVLDVRTEPDGAEGLLLTVSVPADADWDGLVHVTVTCYDRDPVGSVEPPGVASLLLNVTVLPPLPPPNLRPLAPIISGHSKVVLGEELELTAVGASDPEGGALMYRWDHDGIELAAFNASNVLRTRALPVGVHNITVTVRDVGGLTNSTTFQVEVIPSPEEPPEPTDGASYALVAVLLVIAVGAAIAAYVLLRRADPRAPPGGNL